MEIFDGDQSVRYVSRLALSILCLEGWMYLLYIFLFSAGIPTTFYMFRRMCIFSSECWNHWVWWLSVEEKRATSGCPRVEEVLGTCGSATILPLSDMGGGRQKVGAQWKPTYPPPPTGRRDVVTVAVRCAGFRGQGSCQGLQIHYTPVTPSDSSGPMLKMARLYKWLPEKKTGLHHHTRLSYVGHNRIDFQ